MYDWDVPPAVKLGPIVLVVTYTKVVIVLTELVASVVYIYDILTNCDVARFENSRFSS